MQHEVYLLKIVYPDDKIENILGIIDHNKKIVRIIEVDENHDKGYRERGFINMDYIKKIEIMKKAGCIGDNDSSCEI